MSLDKVPAETYVAADGAFEVDLHRAGRWGEGLGECSASESFRREVDREDILSEGGYCQAGAAHTYTIAEMSVCEDWSCIGDC